MCVWAISKAVVCAVGKPDASPLIGMYGPTYFVSRDSAGVRKLVLVTSLVMSIFGVGGSSVYES